MESSKKNIIIGVIVAVVIIVGFVLYQRGLTPKSEKQIKIQQSPEESTVEGTKEGIEIRSTSEEQAIDIMSQAVRQEDISVCQKIKLSQLQKICEREVIINKATTKIDLKTCEQLKEDVDKTNCKDRVTVYQAVRANDRNICNKIINESLREQCKTQAVPAQ